MKTTGIQSHGRLTTLLPLGVVAFIALAKKLLGGSHAGLNEVTEDSGEPSSTGTKTQEVVGMATAASPEKTQAEEPRREVLENPFRAGDRITIPAGTPFRSNNPSLSGRRKTKRTQTITVEEAMSGVRVWTKNGRVLSRLPKVRTTSSGGYEKDISVTDEVVLLNAERY